jgi:hypothetical protein
MLVTFETAGALVDGLGGFTDTGDDDADVGGVAEGDGWTAVLLLLLLLLPLSLAQCDWSIAMLSTMTWLPPTPLP